MLHISRWQKLLRMQLKCLANQETEDHNVLILLRLYCSVSILYFMLIHSMLYYDLLISELK